MVVYGGTSAALAPEPATAVMRRILVPNSASTTVWPRSGFGSGVIGCGALSVIRPAHRSTLPLVAGGLPPVLGCGATPPVAAATGGVPPVALGGGGAGGVPPFALGGAAGVPPVVPLGVPTPAV